MTAQQLKNSILQMAVQGKLVPQDPNDEPASVLLERIKAEKEELIKAGKIKKDKKSSEIFRGASRNLPYTYCEQIGKEVKDISDEIPFEIPESWCWCRLGTIFNLQAGKNISSSEIKEEPFSESYPCYGGNGIRGYVAYSNHNGDYPIIGRQGALCGNINRATGLFYATEHAVCVDTFANTNVSWACLFLKALNLNQYATATAQPGLAVSNIIEVLISLPPLAEQQRIVSKIEELLPYIEAYEQAETQLTALNSSFPDMLKKSILQEAVQGKLVPQNPDDEPASVLLERIKAEKHKLVKEGKIKKEKPLAPITEEEIPFEIPDSWCWCRLSDICQSITDGDHQPPPQVPKGKPFIVISNVSGGKIDFSNTRYVPEEYYKNLDFNRKPTKNDILFTVTGSYGIVMKVDTDREFCFQRHIALLKPFLVDTDFLVHWLKTPLVFKQCKEKATGTAQKTVGLTSLKNIIIALPPLAEQKRIVAKIEEIIQYCDKL